MVIATCTLIYGYAIELQTFLEDNAEALGYVAEDWDNEVNEWWMEESTMVGYKPNGVSITMEIPHDGGDYAEHVVVGQKLGTLYVGRCVESGADAVMSIQPQDCDREALQDLVLREYTISVEEPPKVWIVANDCACCS
jgi:hypothetical protein